MRLEDTLARGVASEQRVRGQGLPAPPGPFLSLGGSGGPDTGPAYPTEQMPTAAVRASDGSIAPGGIPVQSENRRRIAPAGQTWYRKPWPGFLRAVQWWAAYGRRSIGEGDPEGASARHPKRHKA